MSVDVMAPPPAALAPVGPRKRPWWRRPAVLALAVLAAVAGVDSAKDHYDRTLRLEPLRVVERAAADQPIRVLSPQQADRWGGQGPIERDVASMVGPGNAYLEPVFHDLHTLGPDHTADRCYYLAVAPGGVFDADQVTMIGRICYLDPYAAPQSVSFVSPFVPRDR